MFVDHSPELYVCMCICVSIEKDREFEAVYSTHYANAIVVLVHSLSISLYVFHLVSTLLFANSFNPLAIHIIRMLLIALLHTHTFSHIIFILYSEHSRSIDTEFTIQIDEKGLELRVYAPKRANST